MTETPLPSTSDTDSGATGDATTGAPDVTALQAEVAKWKALSRKNERAFKDADQELATVRQAAMTDQEKALEQAREEARSSTLAEVGTQLVAAELRTQAAAAGATLPGPDYLNLNRFLGTNSTPDTDAIKAFVATLTPTAPAYRQDLGLGRQGTTQAGQLTHADLSRMTPSQINEARSKGLLDAVMRGEL
ncbi:hypothetical protein ACFWBI_07775 [Streptomyces sp. NPDC059982]|uniref:hypothetical protein n=1 Tax=unclassified Streptomyces TaxID=2593676 RepID=UPI0036C9D1AB